MKNVPLAYDDEATRSLLTDLSRCLVRVTAIRDNRNVSRTVICDPPDHVTVVRNVGHSDCREVVRRIAAHLESPFVILSDDRRDETNKLVWLELGAVPYTTKLIGVRKLRAHVVSTLRRGRRRCSGSKYVKSHYPDNSSLDGADCIFDKVVLVDRARRDLQLKGLKILSMPLLVALSLFALSTTDLHADDKGEAAIARKHEPLSPLPTAPVLSETKVRLGGRLFHDPILSGRQTLACSSCHDLATGGTIRAQRTVGYEGRMHAFNAPTIFNVGNNYRLGWRGKHTSLEVQNENVLLDTNLMANDWETLIPRLSATPFYRTQFASVYNSQPKREAVLDALVAFQRSLATPNAPFDRFLQGERDAITPSQQYGYKLFKEYGCVSCHQGSNVGGNMFQIFGVFADPTTVDLPASKTPQWPLSAAQQDQETFRVPSLRNVEVTAPYFHDGRAETLSEAVSIMGITQLGRELATDEIDAIVAFLQSLTGDYNGKRLETSVHEDQR